MTDSDSRVTMRLEKRLEIHPCVLAGQPTLVYERGLEKNFPVSFRALEQYAKANDYGIMEDRRANFLEGVKRVSHPSRANLLTILVLTASLVAQTTQAGGMAAAADLSPASASEQVQVEAVIDLAESEYASDEELMHGLLDWINRHISTTREIDAVPALEIVSAGKIAEIAFGRTLPANIDTSTLNILGLYNFNEKTIYLLDTVDLDTESGRGILLHELVHYLQYEQELEKQAECKNELEALAYILETKYLRQQGQQAGFSRQHIDRISECPT